MRGNFDSSKKAIIKTFDAFSRKADYSFLEFLNSDPQADPKGEDHIQREVFSGHYVPVTPKKLSSFKYLSHSKAFFKELGLSDDLVNDKKFARLFSGDISVANNFMRPYGWATSYALSICGTEYISQCPFRTGNGYGDGRAISVFEGIFEDKRWEMQLKGSGPTPFCRGADGRAVLRSSIREFLVQDFMHALGVKTSRSLTIYYSRNEVVLRPWYKEYSCSIDPEILTENLVAITTRVAPSFLRVGQIELFARRVRNNSHEKALNELHMIVKHLISRNYDSEIDNSIDFSDQVLKLALLYKDRLSSLIASWIQVGFCQGNFNSDNCAAGGFTLDYGPFGFCELFDPKYQSWTGGGEHYSFLNQPVAAKHNFQMFCQSLKFLVSDDRYLYLLDEIINDFPKTMNDKMNNMWKNKLGINKYDKNLVNNLLRLMYRSKADFTIFFRKLSDIPNEFSHLKESFYAPSSSTLNSEWEKWFKQWFSSLKVSTNIESLSSEMKRINPRYTWREWLIVPIYKAAEKGDYSLLEEIQDVFQKPYEDQSKPIQNKYDRLRPVEYFNRGGISHYSCSS